MKILNIVFYDVWENLTKTSERVLPDSSGGISGDVQFISTAPLLFSNADGGA